MSEQVREVINSLNIVIDAIKAGHPASSTDQNITQPLNLVINANFPPISKQQVINYVNLEIIRLQNLSTEFDDNFLEGLTDLNNYISEEAKKITLLLNQSNQIFFDKIVQIISIVNLTFQQYFDWQHTTDPKKLPREIKQRITIVQTALNEVEEQSKNIDQKVKIINEAYDTATELPVLLQDLKNNRKELDNIKNISSENSTLIKTNKTNAENDLKSISSTKDQAGKLIEDANAILKEMQDKLTISTSLGLAHAFNKRSQDLKITSRWWTGGFIISLIATFIFAIMRFNDLKESITQESPISYVIIQIIISLISLSAPVWFAIISSKQIQKLFTLSEDYAYKASISASYEGYRKEAFDVDADLVKKLLTTALTKVDEAPLRLVGKEQSSSPFEELLNQPHIKKLIEQFPDTKDKLLNIVTNDGKKIDNKKNEDNETPQQNKSTEDESN